MRRDIFDKAMQAEETLGHSIIKGAYLKDLIPVYEDLVRKKIIPTDKENSASFWARARKVMPEQFELEFPCDCSF